MLNYVPKLRIQNLPIANVQALRRDVRDADVLSKDLVLAREWREAGNKAFG